MSEPVRLSELTFVPQPVRNRLRRHGLSTSADVLRAGTVPLAKRLGDAVTISDLRVWQNVCSLLEIEGMSLPWARVLGEEGNIAARDLARRHLSGITDLFAKAQQQGDLAEVPDADAIAAMMVDSARIDTGGVLNATVKDRSDRPLKGALVRCAWVEAKTDAHGRARLLRLPLGQPVDVTVEKTGYSPLTRELSSLAGPNVLEAHRFSMRKRARASTKRPSTRVLSEFDGDVVTVLDGQPARSIEVKNRKVREGDILHFFERLQRGDVKLSSRFKEVRNGQLTILVWRLPSTSLPKGAPVGSDYRVEDGALQRVDVTPERLARWRIARQVMAETKRSGSMKTRLKRALDEYVKRTSALGALD
jgi:Domain of unknown function (DUF4332)